MALKNNFKMPENEINSYFEKNKSEKKIINKENLTSAIRKLISRSISGTRQEMEIKPDTKLKYYIIKEEKNMSVYYFNKNDYH